MARIAGIDLPPNKTVTYGLTAIYGIGLQTAQKIVAEVGVEPSKKIRELSDEEVTKIRKLIEMKYRVEGARRAEIASDIKRLIDIGCYRGLRHKVGLPTRGQRTRTNARTRKGRKRVAVAVPKGIKAAGGSKK
jgi:small subunit ribosomal protein S13